jgi:hypothetical protein
MPYLNFVANQVLTAAQVNDYLMNQSVMTFADATARTAAIAAPTEGMVTYLSDTNALEYYDGSAWVGVSNPGDITAVTAGTALTGGGTSGAVTLDVDLAAVHTADFITDATTARTLTSTDAGKTILFTSGSATVVTVNASTDIPVGQRVDSNASANCHFEIFGLSNSWKRLQGDGSSASSTSGSTYSDMSGLVIPGSSTTSNTFSNASIYISNYSGAAYKPYSVDAVGENNDTTAYQSIVAGVLATTSAITELKIATSASSFASGSTISIYQITAD